MEQKKNAVQKAVKKAVQGMIQRELDGWPPVCARPFYHPRRPEKSLPELDSQNGK